MASLHQLKPRFQNMLRPLVDASARAGITPNQVTLAGLLVSFGAGAALAVLPSSRVALLAIPAVLFARMALNAIDGMLAREHDMRTVSGAFLNELSDVLSDCALYLPFALVLADASAWVFTFVLLALLTEFAGVLAQALGASRRYDGPMGKSDRAFLIGLLALLLGLGVAPGPWCAMLVALGCGLALATVFRRIGAGMAEAGRTK